MPRSTVSAWLKRLGLAKLDALEPKPEIVRYEYEHPGDLLHLDTKKLARIRRPGHRIHGDRSKRGYGVGWENAHVAIDDHSRVAYVEVLPAEDQHTCTALLQRAVEHFASMGVAVRRVMTDNGPGYVSKRFNRLCHQLDNSRSGTFTPGPTPPEPTAKPNGFIRTLKEQWAYGTCYQTSARRTRALRPWLNHYNRHRPHAGIGMTPPIARLSGVSS